MNENSKNDNAPPAFANGALRIEGGGILQGGGREKVKRNKFEIEPGDRAFPLDRNALASHESLVQFSPPFAPRRLASP